MMEPKQREPARGDYIDFAQAIGDSNSLLDLIDRINDPQVVAYTEEDKKRKTNLLRQLQEIVDEKGIEEVIKEARAMNKKGVPVKDPLLQKIFEGLGGYITGELSFILERSKESQSPSDERPSEARRDSQSKPERLSKKVFMQEYKRIGQEITAAARQHNIGEIIAIIQNPNNSSVFFTAGENPKQIADDILALAALLTKLKEGQTSDTNIKQLISQQVEKISNIFRIQTICKMMAKNYLKRYIEHTPNKSIGQKIRQRVQKIFKAK